MKVIIFTSFLSSILVPILAPAPFPMWPYPGTNPIFPSSIESSPSKASTPPVAPEIEKNISPNNEPVSNEPDINNPTLNGKTTTVESSVAPKSPTLPRSRLNVHRDCIRHKSELGTTSSNSSQATVDGQNEKEPLTTKKNAARNKRKRVIKKKVVAKDMNSFSNDRSKVIQSLFRLNDDEDTDPFSNGRSNVEADTNISSPSRSQSPTSPSLVSYPLRNYYMTG